MGRLRRKRRKNSRPVKMKQGQMADWLLFLGDGIDRGISLRRLVNMSQRLYPKWQGMFDEIDQAMLMGKPFAEALGPWLSVDTYYQLRLAERHGKLAETIHQVGKFLALQAKQRARLRAVMQYPVILLVFLVLVIVMVIHFVLPEVASWGSGAGHSPVGYHNWFNVRGGTTRFSGPVGRPVDDNGPRAARPLLVHPAGNWATHQVLLVLLPSGQRSRDGRKRDVPTRN